MGERPLTEHERAEFERSYESSKERLEEIYRNVLMWKVHDRPEYQVEAHKQKNALVEELDDYLPLYMPNINAFSPPAHARIQGRRAFTPLNMELSDMEGGLKKKRRSTKRRSRRRAHSR